MNIQNYTGLRPIVPEAQDNQANSRNTGRIDALNSASNLPPEMDEKLRAVCQDFEAFFMYQLLKEMQNTVNETKFLHGGRAEEIFRDMMYDEMSQKMAKVDGGPLGIAQMLYQQLTRPVVK